MSASDSQLDERARELVERVKSGIQGGAVVGGCYGAFKGVQEERLAGSVGRAFVRGVAKRTVFTSAGFAVFMSLYSSSLFAIEQVNSLAAGCVAGAAVALNTRNVPVICLSSALSGVLMLGVDVGWKAGTWLDDKRREMTDSQQTKKPGAAAKSDADAAAETSR